ncbi:unnamed protein product [Aphanomyces euteiches]
MGHPTVHDTSKVSSTQPSEAPQLPQYAVDFHVKIKTGFLGKTVKFARRQFVLTGQTLEVRHQGKTTHSFAGCDITIELLSGHVYRLKAKYSRQSYVMGQGRLGYVYFDATAPGKAESGGCVCAGYAHAGCGSSGCGSGGCGSGGCGDGGGDGGGGCGGGCGGCGGCA